MSLLTKVVVRLAADLSDYDKGLQQATRKTETWSKNLRKTGKRLTAGLTAPILGFLGYSTDKASDLYESINKVEVVFGDAADSVLDFARNADTALGMSSQAALEAAATYGNLFESVGLAKDASADMSMELVQLASDLASFNNLDPTDVLQKLQSGLVGEVEPLRSLGINLSATAVKAKALEMGLADTADALTPAMLMQARYALILEQSANAHGDFARTSNGVANSARIVRAQLANLSAKLGGVLLPYVMKALNVGKQLLSWMSGMDESTQRWVVGTLLLVAAVGPLLLLLGSLAGAVSNISGLVSGFGTLLSSSLFWPILAVVGALALLVVAWKNDWGGIQEKAAAVWAWLQPMLTELTTWVGEKLPVATQFLANVWDNYLSPAFIAVGNFVSGTLWPILQTLGGWLVTVGAAQIKAFTFVWQNILAPALKIVWRIFSELLWPVVKAIADFLHAVFSVELRILEGIFSNYLAPAISTVVEWFDARLMPILEKIGDFLKKTFNPLWDGLNSSLDRMRDLIGGLVQKLEDFAQKLRSLDLPDWLTPGSPTPWEIALWGLNKALGAVADNGLADMNAQLRVGYEYDSPPGLRAALAYPVAGSVAATSGGGAPIINFTYAPAVSLGDRVEAERVIAPILAEKLRELSK